MLAEIEHQLKEEEIAIEVYVRQRNNRKYITLVKNFRHTHVMVQELRHLLNCRVTVIDDSLEFSGDQRESIRKYLTEHGHKVIIVHGPSV
jgi:translation initiation factor 1 (eIF-1/SUI1)